MWHRGSKSVTRRSLNASLMRHILQFTCFKILLQNPNIFFITDVMLVWFGQSWKVRKWKKKLRIFVSRGSHELISLQFFWAIGGYILYCWTWWCIGRVKAFRPEGRGFESRSSRHVGTLGKSLTCSCLWRFSVKFRHSIRAVSGALLSRSGLEEAL